MIEPGELAGRLDEATDEALMACQRLWDRDHTLWGDDPTEISDRLGWLDVPERLAEEAAVIDVVVGQMDAAGVTDVLLVGMGGSSLYPEVVANTADVASSTRGRRLQVLDSTDPAAVLAAEAGTTWANGALIVASKSGSTIETISHLDRFAWRLGDEHGVDGSSRIVAITDPGSPLEGRARAEGFGAVVHGRTDVGGRFSALTAFGLLPARVVGVDIAAHVAVAEAQLATSRSRDARVNVPAALGAVLGAAVRAGRDKLVIVLPERLQVFGSWIEQLVAESTGKHGTGVLPVLDTDPRELARLDDLVVVAYGRHDLADLAVAGVPIVEIDDPGFSGLAGEVVRWEIAVAVAGALMGVNPFDQPDVARAKDATRRALEAGGQLPPYDDADAALATIRPGDYIAVLGFVTPGGPDDELLRDAARRLSARHGVPATVGIGPRYLHSTGQLHKGGSDGGVFLVAVGDDPHDAGIPGRDHGFATLKRAQAAGDIAALRDVGRRVAHVTIEDLAGR